jgi:hypothetical protein
VQRGLDQNHSRGTIQVAGRNIQVETHYCSYVPLSHTLNWASGLRDPKQIVLVFKAGGQRNKTGTRLDK